MFQRHIEYKQHLTANILRPGTAVVPRDQTERSIVYNYFFLQTIGCESLQQLAHNQIFDIIDVLRSLHHTVLLDFTF